MESEFYMNTLPGWKPFLRDFDKGVADVELTSVKDYNIDNWDGVTSIITNEWKTKFISDLICFELNIHPGFITDGGSIPAVFRNIINPYGIGILGFLIHDAVYGTHYLSQEQADYVLREIHKLSGISWAKYAMIYRSVRCCGHGPYNNKSEEVLTKNKSLITFDIIETII